jgi:hypothetical protein
VRIAHGEFTASFLAIRFAKINCAYTSRKQRRLAQASAPPIGDTERINELQQTCKMGE